MSAVVRTVSSPAPPRRGFRRFWIALRQLFHELVGGLFAVLALFWVQTALRAWRRDAAYWLVGTAAFFAGLLAGVFLYFLFALGAGAGCLNNNVRPRPHK